MQSWIWNSRGNTRNKHLKYTAAISFSSLFFLSLVHLFTSLLILHVPYAMTLSWTELLQEQVTRCMRMAVGPAVGITKGLVSTYKNLCPSVRCSALISRLVEWWWKWPGGYRIEEVQDLSHSVKLSQAREMEDRTKSDLVVMNHLQTGELL